MGRSQSHEGSREGARPSAKSKPAGDGPGLSRERVCAEALALVDDEGLDALSMRRLGARLGVEAMSLYRHVRDKADLLDALHVAVLADLAPAQAPPAESDAPPWRILLGGMARSLRATMLRHPNVAALFATRPVLAPEAVATIHHVVAALEEAGFSRAAAEMAAVEIGIFTVGHALAEASRTTTVSAPRAAGPDEFAFGLAALLDGLGRHATRAPATRGKKNRSG